MDNLLTKHILQLVTIWFLFSAFCTVFVSHRKSRLLLFPRKATLSVTTVLFVSLTYRRLSLVELFKHFARTTQLL